MQAIRQRAAGLPADDCRDYFSATLNPANRETFSFLDRLFGEMAALSPDRYFHVGGDELSGADCKANPQVQASWRVKWLT